MATPVSKKLVQDYFDAQLTRDPARIAPFLHNDVEWSIAGPVDLLHYCGERHGKQAMLEATCVHVPTLIKLTDIDFEEILVDGDRAAAFTRVSGMHTPSGRHLSYRCAQFLRFREGKLIEFRVLIDSFDAAEQMLGHPIEVVAPHETPENVFAV
jgi:ketosteroid isomerase-like protein